MTDIVENIEVDRIVVEPNRLRKLQPAAVDQLAESLKERGQIAPIVVAVNGQSDGLYYNLIAGAHRLAAVKKLALPTIRAIITCSSGADQALLIEIDENLIRANLSPAEEAMHIDKRKEIYERLYPSTKHGGDRSRPQNENLKSFTKDTAKKSGKGRSTVARAATRGKKLKKELPEIVGTSLDEGAEMDALAKLPEKERAPIIAAAKAGKKISAKPKSKDLTTVGAGIVDGISAAINGFVSAETPEVSAKKRTIGEGNTAGLDEFEECCTRLLPTFDKVDIAEARSIFDRVCKQAAARRKSAT